MRVQISPAVRVNGPESKGCAMREEAVCVPQVTPGEDETDRLAQRRTKKEPAR